MLKVHDELTGTDREIFDDTPDSLLLGARDACRLCGTSLRTWRSWDSAGKVPRPVRIGRMVFWRRVELLAWIEAGCPRRHEWEAKNVARSA